MSKAKDKLQGTGLRGQITFRDVAREAIHAQTAKDEAREAGVSMADHFLMAAQGYSEGINLKDEDSRKKLVEKVVAAIETESAFMKSENCPIVDRWDKVPDAWTQCKSNVKKGIEAGFNPCDYKSMSKYRKALNDYRKAEQGEGGQTAADNAKDIAAANPEIGQRLLALVGTVEGTTAEQQPDVLALLDKVIEDIKVLRHLVPVTPSRPKSAKDALTANKAKA